MELISQNTRLLNALKWAFRDNTITLKRSVDNYKKIFLYLDGEETSVYITNDEHFQNMLSIGHNGDSTKAFIEYANLIINQICQFMWIRQTGINQEYQWYLREPYLSFCEKHQQAYKSFERAPQSL